MALAAGIGAAGSILGGITGGKGASKAAQIQAQAQANALAEQQREYNQNQANFAPFISTGTSALGAQSNLLGLNGNDAQQSAVTNLENSPLFTSLDKSGTDALLQAAAATGGLRGGNTESALYNNRSTLLANVIQNQLSNLGSVSSLGVGAAGTAGGLGNATSSNISNILQQQGNTQASNTLAQGAITGSTFNSLSQILQNALANNNNGNVSANSSFLNSFYPSAGASNAQLNNLVVKPFSW